MKASFPPGPGFVGGDGAGQGLGLPHPAVLRSHTSPGTASRWRCQVGEGRVGPQEVAKCQEQLQPFKGQCLFSPSSVVAEAQWG